jgi:hypothetical protein
MKHPEDTPLPEWPSGWLRMEVANLYDLPEYLIMTDDEKRSAKMPVTDPEMRWAIAVRRGRRANPGLTRAQVTPRTR